MNIAGPTPVNIGARSPFGTQNVVHFSTHAIRQAQASVDRVLDLFSVTQLTQQRVTQGLSWVAERQIQATLSTKLR